MIIKDYAVTHKTLHVILSNYELVTTCQAFELHVWHSEWNQSDKSP